MVSRISFFVHHKKGRPGLDATTTYPPLHAAIFRATGTTVLMLLSLHIAVRQYTNLHCARVRFSSSTFTRYHVLTPLSDRTLFSSTAMGDIRLFCLRAPPLITCAVPSYISYISYFMLVIFLGPYSNHFLLFRFLFCFFLIFSAIVQPCILDSYCCMYPSNHSMSRTTKKTESIYRRCWPHELTVSCVLICVAFYSSRVGRH